VSRWSAAPGDLVADPGRVHVWRVALAPGALDDAEVLSAEERDRAAAFRFAPDARRFVAAHVALRSILGRYLGIAPGAVAIETAALGKPRLAGRARRLRFNLSHSDDLALCAVALDREVGVDAERRRAVLADEAAAAIVFTDRERAALRAAPPQRRVEAFFDLWVLKEAYLKGRGDGLAVDPRQLEVVPAPEGWALAPLSVDADFAAAVAVQGPRCPIDCWHWRA
jgi:4'-phosphopantetheinyl transferase